MKYVVCKSLILGRASAAPDYLASPLPCLYCEQLKRIESKEKPFRMSQNVHPSIGGSKMPGQRGRKRSRNTEIHKRAVIASYLWQRVFIRCRILPVQSLQRAGGLTILPAQLVQAKQHGLSRQLLFIFFFSIPSQLQAHSSQLQFGSRAGRLCDQVYKLSGCVSPNADAYFYYRRKEGVLQLIQPLSYPAPFYLFLFLSNSNQVSSDRLK